MFSLLYKYSQFVIICKVVGIKPPLRLFEIKNKHPITHALVFENKLYKRIFWW